MPPVWCRVAHFLLLNLIFLEKMGPSAIRSGDGITPEDSFSRSMDMNTPDETIDS
jgi:hypothetical protein